MALRYWVAVQQRSIKLAQDCPGQFLLLNYDNLCVNPPLELDKLLSFLSLTVTAEQRKHLLSLPMIPEGINRYQAHDLSCFAAEDIRYIKSLGFNVDPQCNESNGEGDNHV